MQGREQEQFALFGTGPIAELVPDNHPLKTIRAIFDQAWANLGAAFDTSYGQVGNVSIPSAVLVRTRLFKALYSIKGERAVCEQIQFDAFFRWIVGLDWDQIVFDQSTLSKNRERRFGNGGAKAFLGEVVRQVRAPASKRPPRGRWHACSGKGQPGSRACLSHGWDRTKRIGGRNGVLYT